MNIGLKIRKTLALALAVFLFFCSESIARGAGVTVITHGLNGNVNGWVTGMANQIPDYHSFPGSNHTFYKLYFYYSGGFYYLTWSRLGGVPPSSSDSGEIIVAFDWSQLADGNSYDTYDIATVLSSALQNSSLISELNGHALGEFPMHLIGHSRGGSLMAETSRQLGTNGIWVDHVTTLDPHPLNDPAFPLDFLLYSAVDAPARTYENVLFHDNYWQDEAVAVYGMPVPGAYIRQLYNVSGGYQNVGDAYYPHSNVHLWYHATVDERNPANDTEAQVTATEFGAWYSAYEQYGFSAGFKWSLIGGGNRASSDQPLGMGYPAIRDGYNQVWDFGAGTSGNRTALPAKNGSWPNIIKFNILGSNTVPVGSSVSAKYFYQFGVAAAPSATVQVFLDADANPLNGNNGQVFQFTETGTGTSIVRNRTISFNATNPPGQYCVYGKVTGGTRVRYLHAPEKLTINPPPDTTKPTVAIASPPSPKTYTNSQTVTISSSASDNVGVMRVEFYDGPTLAGTDSIAAYTFDWSFTAADNGPHVWTARAYDAAGNVSTSSPVTLTVSIDITSPAVSISIPVNGATIATSPLTVSGTASDLGSPSSGLSLVEVRVNGGAWQAASGTAIWSRSVALMPCSNIIAARSRDIAGNYSPIASNLVTYILVNTVPNTPSNLSPPNAATNLPIAPLFEASAFVDPDCIGDSHAASQWQVLNSAGTVVVADSGTDAVNRVSWPIPATKLFYGSNYQWHVRYRDSRGGWSGYSPQTTFTIGGPTLSESKQGANVVLKWPTNALGFTLQWSTNLGTLNWSNAAPAPTIVNGRYTVTNAATNRARFYRLRK